MVLRGLLFFLLQHACFMLCRALLSVCALFSCLAAPFCLRSAQDKDEAKSRAAATGTSPQRAVSCVQCSEPFHSLLF